jgi:hypothetical protein
VGRAGRGARAADWKTSKERGHPLYELSSHEVGKLPLGYKLSYPLPEAGRTAGFTKKLGHTGALRATGMRTGVNRHRYLPELDGIISDS